MMICANQLYKAEKVTTYCVETILQLLAPLAPHMCEEIWLRLGHCTSIVKAGWPKCDESKLLQKTSKIIFQVNGKYRGDAELPNGIDKAAAISSAMSHPRVISFIDGKSIKKEIYIPGKIVNIVAV